MGSSQVVPWYDRPARPFPAKLWLMQQPYPFRVSPSMFARTQPAPLARWPMGWRPFPARLWREGKQQAAAARLR